MATMKVFVLLLVLGIAAAASTKQGRRRPRHPQGAYGAPQQQQQQQQQPGVGGPSNPPPRPQGQPVNPQQAPPRVPAPGPQQGGAAGSYAGDANQPGMPYNFAWAVKDEPTYNDYAHQENSDGRVVSGSYRVLLPDGRTQIVTYRVEGESGFVAEVRYEGTAGTGPNPAASNSAVLGAGQPPQRAPNAQNNNNPQARY